jgi:hypothetical protein
MNEPDDDKRLMTSDERWHPNRGWDGGWVVWAVLALMVFALIIGRDYYNWAIQ